MKKLVLSVLAIAGMLVAIATIYACSSDEADEQNLTQAQLLMQKSKEFAKKYGVDMTLNEEKFEETAKTLTVEQMEKDYQKMAQFNVKMFTPNNKKSALSINKLRIRKKSPNFETTSISGDFTCNGDYGTVVKVEYSIGNGAGNSYARVTLTRSEASGTAILIPQGITEYASDDCEFTASGTVTITNDEYRVDYHVFVTHAKTGNSCSVSIDSSISSYSANNDVVSKVDYEKKDSLRTNKNHASK